MQLQISIVTACLEDELPMTRRITWTEDDPRHIHPTIAGTLPPPTRELVEHHKSRFSSQPVSRSQNNDLSDYSPPRSLSESIATTSDLPSLDSD